MPTFSMIHGDCLDAMKKLANCSVDSVVTDPPYGLRFMGKAWDHSVPSVDVWRECLRVLKPGGHLLAFAGTRTQHRMACAIEDAGFEIRDMIAWVYGSGFPKSKNLDGDWQGWGTAIKPALEPITVARKPLAGTVAENVLTHGTGAINVDGCRVGTNPGYKYRADANGTTFHGKQGERIKQSAEKKGSEFIESTQGRWPANIIHDGSDEVLGLFPQTVGKIGMVGNTGGNNRIYGKLGRQEDRQPGTTDSGSAARFFYCAKASKRDRDDGCKSNNHPTVKPTDLMRYLVRLVTPSNGLVLDPFAGTGSTGRGAILEGMQFLGIEKDEAYVNIANKRIQVLLGDLFNADT